MLAISFERASFVFDVFWQVWQPWAAQRCLTSCSRTSRISTRSCARTCETRRPASSLTSRKVCDYSQAGWKRFIIQDTCLSLTIKPDTLILRIRSSCWIIPFNLLFSFIITSKITTNQWILLKLCHTKIAWLEESAACTVRMGHAVLKEMQLDIKSTVYGPPQSLTTQSLSLTNKIN